MDKEVRKIEKAILKEVSVTPDGLKPGVVILDEVDIENRPPTVPEDVKQLPFLSLAKPMSIEQMEKWDKEWKKYMLSRTKMPIIGWDHCEPSFYTIGVDFAKEGTRDYTVISKMEPVPGRRYASLTHHFVLNIDMTDGQRRHLLHLIDTEKIWEMMEEELIKEIEGIL